MICSIFEHTTGEIIFQRIVSFLKEKGLDLKQIKTLETDISPTVAAACKRQWTLLQQIINFIHLYLSFQGSRFTYLSLLGEICLGEREMLHLVSQ